MAETDHDHAALMPSPVSGDTAHTRRALVLLLAVRLVLSIAFSLATPLGEAPDEADHYAYAAYILEKGELPAGPEMTQGKHPPLYHILAAAAGKLVGGSPDRSFLRANPDMAFGPQSQATNFFIHTTVEDWPWRAGVLTMRAGRFVSMVAGLVLVIATYLLGRAIWPARPELALAGAAFAAFLPESLFVSGAMSNDMLAAMWSTLALWLALRSARIRTQAVSRNKPDRPAIENIHTSTGQRAGQPIQPDRPAINRRASKQRPLNAGGPLPSAKPSGGCSVSPLEGALLRSPASLAPGGGGATRGSPLHEQILNVQNRRAFLSAVLTGVCLGLAFVTKASTGSLAVIVTAVFLVSAWQNAHRHSQGSWLWPGLVQVTLAGAAAFLIAAPWLWRNWRLYGDPFGWPVVLATIDQRQGPLGLADVMQLLSGWWLSFWGKFGGAGHIPLPATLYVIWAAIGVAALAGWILHLVGKTREREARELEVPGTSKVPGTYGHAQVPGTYGHAQVPGTYGHAQVPGTYGHAQVPGTYGRRRVPGTYGRACEWIILLGAPLVTAAGIYSYSKVALGTDQGRLLFPALGPLALLVVGGLSAWLPQRAAGAAAARQTALLTGLSGSMALLAIASLITGLLQPFAAPPAPQPDRIAAAQPVNATFGPLELVATAWDDPAPGQLTLYWRAAQRTSSDLRTALRLLDTGGNLLWEWKRSPGAGRLSTDRWLPGRVVADTYRLPQEALSQAVRAEVGVRPFPEEPWVPVTGLAPDQLLSIPR